MSGGLPGAGDRPGPSKRALAGLLDLVDRPAFICAPDGEILFGNAAASRLCEATAAGLAGRSLPEALEIDDGGPLLRRLRASPAAAALGPAAAAALVPGRELQLLVRPLPPARPDSPRGVVVLGADGPSEPGRPGVPGDHFAGLAHELRQPVQAALGYSELLATGTFGALKTEQEDAARRVHELIVGLAGMLEELLRRPDGERPSP